MGNDENFENLYTDRFEKIARKIIREEMAACGQGIGHSKDIERLDGEVQTVKTSITNESTERKDVIGKIFDKMDRVQVYVIVELIALTGFLVWQIILLMNNKPPVVG